MFSAGAGKPVPARQLCDLALTQLMLRCSVASCVATAPILAVTAVTHPRRELPARLDFETPKPD